jgi:MFS family permease
VVPDVDEDEKETSAFEVFQHRPFLLLWLSQVFTQIGGNMVLFGLTVIVLDSGAGNTAVSLLILSFLVPAVLFSAVAGVYVDRLDKRLVLVATNLLRAGFLVLLWMAGANLLLLLVINTLISSVTVFFAPAEASMIPELLPRPLLLPANGLFTLTLNAAFAVGYAVAGPLVVALLGAPGLILVVAACYLIAAGFCWTLPPAPPVTDEEAESGALLPETEAAMGSVFGQLREGIEFIRENPSIGWSLVYLGIAASMVGVLGVLGPRFATESLGLQPKDFAVVVLPLGFGVVMGILALNSFGHLVPRRRIIEGGLVALGIFVSVIVLAGPISRALQHVTASTSFGQEVASLTSLLAIVVCVAFAAGIAYAFVAIPSQTQLQEDIPEEGRGRVFGVLNMLVFVSSFLPIIIVGPMSDVVGTTPVLVIAAVLVTIAGIYSIVSRGPLKEAEAHSPATGPTLPSGLDPVAVATASDLREGYRRSARADGGSRGAATATAPVATTPVADEPAPPFEPNPDEHE